MVDLPSKGWDQSWSYLPPAAAVKAGLGVVSGYLSYTASKNITAADIIAYHKAGIAVILNWEAFAVRLSTVRHAATNTAPWRRCRLCSLSTRSGTHRKNKLTLYFSCDRDVSVANFPAIDDYYRGTRAEIVPAFENGCYGEADVIEHLHNAGLVAHEWQTVAWSMGRLYQGADYYQTGINAKLSGADIDYDDVRHPRQLGAWWPPGHPLDAPHPPVPVPVPVPVPTPTPAPAPTPAPWARRLIRQLRGIIRQLNRRK
jgi:hypothetical protein